ncbi:glycerophosphodiester phosphodiesterase [Roseivirga sp.]|uniref:glycerophosphodiester phosphodiesterase n=1 Tax=Roseivirga sp. TaxID=1964215 RepID=UPI002B264A2A|nr:glycerophosphodiester phosphodiesterase family protein [Roseivirga sp.]
MNKSFLICALLFFTTIVQAQTKVIAHRGFSGIAPENTLAAFQKAIDHQFEYYELDIHKTKDDSLVVIHDASVNRTSSNGMKGKIAEMTYEELSNVSVGYASKFEDEFKDEKIPTLREALAMSKRQIKVCVEIKVNGMEQEMIDIINDLDMKNEVIIFSFYYQALEKVRQLDKDIPILYLVGSANEGSIDMAKAIDAQAIGAGGGNPITKDYISKAHKSGIEVWRWTVDDEKTMKSLIEVGVDGIISNFPDRLVKLPGVKIKN